MAEESKKYSFVTITLTALVSFLISGVGGALLQRYLSRAQPLVTVTSAGFEGPADFIEIPDELITSTEDDAWGETLSKYEKFTKLRERESTAAETEARLAHCLSLATGWLNASATGPTQVSPDEIRHHLVVSDTCFVSSMNGSIRRRELQAPPNTNLTTLPTVFPVIDSDDGPAMTTGKKTIIFSTARLRGQDELDANHLIANSFGKGSRANIVHYTKFFIDNENANLLMVKKVREQLRKLILEQARPSVSINVHNAGDATAALRPYFGMTVLGSDGKTITDKYVMLVAGNAAATESDPLVRMLREQLGQQEDSSKKVYVAPYLPATGGLSYTTVAPGGSQTLRLVATERLGAKGSQYQASYESGLLKTKIMALTASGDSIWSDVAVFGGNVDKTAEDELLGQMR